MFSKGDFTTRITNTLDILAKNLIKKTILLKKESKLNYQDRTLLLR